MRSINCICLITILFAPLAANADCSSCSCDNNSTQACICVDHNLGPGGDRADFGHWYFDAPPPYASGATFTLPTAGAPTSSNANLVLDETDASPQLEICLKPAQDGSSMGKTYYLIGNNFSGAFIDISPIQNGLAITGTMEFDGGPSATESSHSTYTGTPINWFVHGSVTFSSADLNTIAANLPSESDFLLPLDIQLWEEAP